MWRKSNTQSTCSSNQKSLTRTGISTMWKCSGRERCKKLQVKLNMPELQWTTWSTRCNFADNQWRGNLLQTNRKKLLKVYENIRLMHQNLGSTSQRCATTWQLNVWRNLKSIKSRSVPMRKLLKKNGGSCRNLEKAQSSLKKMAEFIWGSCFP